MKMIAVTAKQSIWINLNGFSNLDQMNIKISQKLRL